MCASIRPGVMDDVMMHVDADADDITRKSTSPVKRSKQTASEKKTKSASASKSAKKKKTSSTSTSTSTSSHVDTYEDVTAVGVEEPAPSKRKRAVKRKEEKNMEEEILVSAEQTSVVCGGMSCVLSCVLSRVMSCHVMCAWMSCAWC